MRRRRHASTSRASSIRRRKRKTNMRTCITRSTARMRRRRARGSDLSRELLRGVLALDPRFAGLALVPVREDAEQQVGPGERILGALDDDRRSPRRIELVTDRGLALSDVESVLVPLQHGVAAHDALLVASLVGPPAMRVGMLALADCGRTRMHRHPLVHVGVLALGAGGIGRAIALLSERAEVVEEHRAQYMDVIRSKTVNVMGLRTRVLEEGEAGGGDPVVMIHGVGGWAENWREVMSPIARTGRHAIAFDLPGFGQSDQIGRASCRERV